MTRPRSSPPIPLIVDPSVDVVINRTSPTDLDSSEKLGVANGTDVRRFGSCARAIEQTLCMKESMSDVIGSSPTADVVDVVRRRPSKSAPIRLEVSDGLPSTSPTLRSQLFCHVATTTSAQPPFIGVRVVMNDHS